jgi:hypothetical protein
MRAGKGHIVLPQILFDFRVLPFENSELHEVSQMDGKTEYTKQALERGCYL